MIKGGIEAFSGKRILLLQGPVGPFFRRLASDLRNVGAEVFKVNFNAGDWLFYPKDALNYRGGMERWPAEIECLLKRLRIDLLMLFGDCRPVHRIAHAAASRLGIEIGVFEEGYIRPNYVTLERDGVNGYSLLSNEFHRHIQSAPVEVPEERQVGKTFWPMVLWGFLYFTAGGLGFLFFPHYRHHRPLSVLEALPWIRSVWRKYWYAIREKGVLDELTERWHKRYYLVPLQVHNDAQITEHSGFGDIESFITAVISSFARYAPKGTVLVFKHHPMDRGYQDYSALIRQSSERERIGSRVYYLHDQHLPTLLKHALGVTVINSTVGLSAVHHGVPTKVCGSAIYDREGLTSRKSLGEFWKYAKTEKPDPVMYNRFRAHLIVSTQLNGSFYKLLTHTGLRCGLLWSSRPSLSASGWIERDLYPLVVETAATALIEIEEDASVM
ncbi:MAG: capsular biosynthesis protein [Chlorobium sp.]|jgi:capsular polysaccharide export protein|nr:capsular biosynthesis protein [Chlorobium sp.]